MVGQKAEAQEASCASARGWWTGGASPHSSVVLSGWRQSVMGPWGFGEVSGTGYGGGRGGMDGRVQGSENGLRVEQGAKEDAGRGSRKSTVTRMDQRRRVEPSERQGRAEPQ